jgi:hypothetical protein
MGGSPLIDSLNEFLTFLATPATDLAIHRVKRPGIRACGYNSVRFR